ncbi:hypothetical protein CK227_10310 [Mesorhizobium sp. WSM4308]|uniref:hypothetical protein n=1 Tax=Mesorhizobium sp. WSM4308 TaxID=2029409 RepID=UPI000BAFB0AB|nr:hypothetical protein [Mesorhizobium sp. WSM4308]PBB75176.1 hypothetical protein CK227_10310 [Mesorhizobium sp. WSM4308]
MAFHDVERGVFKGAAALISTVQVRISKSTPGTAAITISQDVYKKVGEPMFFNIMLGSGEHSGFIALIPRNSKGASSYKAFSTSPTGKACVISISAKKLGLVSKAIATTKLPFEITSDGIIADIRPARNASSAIASLAA